MTLTNIDLIDFYSNENIKKNIKEYDIYNTKQIKKYYFSLFNNDFICHLFDNIVILRYLKGKEYTYKGAVS